MSLPCETVRTDLRAYLAEEVIPFWLHPKACGVHRVTWWTDEPKLEEITGKVSGCPCCDGTLPISVLVLIEEPTNRWHRSRA